MAYNCTSGAAWNRDQPVDDIRCMRFMWADLTQGFWDHPWYSFKVLALGYERVVKVLAEDTCGYSHVEDIVTKRQFVWSRRAEHGGNRLVQFCKGDAQFFPSKNL